MYNLGQWQNTRERQSFAHFLPQATFMEILKLFKTDAKCDQNLGFSPTTNCQNFLEFCLCQSDGQTSNNVPNISPPPQNIQHIV